MNYPIWDLPILGGGVLIGTIAILHVFVSHFAIGGGLFLVLTERKAYRDNDADLLAYLRTHSTFFVLVVLVFGAVSGVGIWWSIGLVSPAATSTLIHVFVWVWAMEWVAFFTEIAAAFVYYYGWDRLSRPTHLAVGWIYFGAAWLSLFQINGILTFMLTPGQWLQSRSLVDAFFNPTMWPSAVIRTAVAVALAGLYALVTASVNPSADLRQRLTRYAAKWLLLGAAVIPVGGLWYIASLPPLAREISMGGAPAVTIFAGLTILFSALLVGLIFVSGYLYPRSFNIGLALIAVVIGLMTTGVTEWVREAVRKPYIIYGYMWSNSIRVADEWTLQESGLLPRAKWAAVSDASVGSQLRAGEEVFRVACQSCHTVHGYNGIRVMVKGWPRALIRYSLDHLDELKGFMPPFIGSNAEREALTDWLYAIGRPATPSAAQRVSSRFPLPAQVWAQIHGELRGAEAVPGRRKP
ncbi:MAG: cytochrome ubiquinol oxidase subunit I [candidate division NC10 bacterium]|nr:cytochrome ubiquinol oxidase subunit I [candidate division NC10 bacterium]MBI2115072.1 cytochrome ubiquinol oxidase subunit I [candidate division NC10 bacterium]MBI2458761.1 cytochrome ubiquinol oxidase subunit I [candidate division NC10 bacterium]MBI3087244.1 cytochrome ubiquinol oxidase subunit I [candidate division NC10 bacterium]